MIRTVSIHDTAAMDKLQERRDYSEPPDYWDEPEEEEEEDEEDEEDDD